MGISLFGSGLSDSSPDTIIIFCDDIAIPNDIAIKDLSFLIIFYLSVLYKFIFLEIYVNYTIIKHEFE